jgi:uncharacterized protein (TIGR00299 family) protein
MPADAGTGLHIHLDPVGGIAGDMFAAAILDARPDLRDGVLKLWAEQPATASAELRAALEPAVRGGITGHRFRPQGLAAAQGHASYREVRERLDMIALPPGASRRAQAMLRALADVEARIHGIDVDAVHFHELAGWDTVIDLATAAWLVHALGPATWSVGPLPLGGGTVATAHGMLPVPAPATAALLEGFVWIDDAVPGERVTPTGAAILRALAPVPRPTAPLRLQAVGHGLGSRDLARVPNLLRATLFKTAEATTGPDADEIVADRVAVMRFEVDDQTPEDLALALDRLRTLPEVKDVCHWPVVGKRGRIGMAVQVIADPGALDAVTAACLAETATIGLRRRLEDRAILDRTARIATTEAGPIGVKRVARPGGEISAKAELVDVRAANATYAGRQRLRRHAETQALDEET